MHSVILTELGVSVFSGENLEKTFPFTDMVSEYVAIKKKESKMDDLVRYLSPIQSGIKVSDEALLEMLKRFSIDAQIMEEEEVDEIQATKPQIMVDSGFAKDIREAQGKLRDFSLGLSSSKISEVSGSPDMHIIQGISALDEIDKTINTMSAGLREWYGLHFPELENIVDSLTGYAHIVLGGKRDTLTRKIIEDAGFPESKIEMITLAASNSRGGDISESNLSIVQSIARHVIDFDRLRWELARHIETQMHESAPNLSTILGVTVGARILRSAGSLKNIATLPASRVQILGAEKALFRSMKTGSRPPKHGLLFQHVMVHKAPRWQRGKIARAIAAKAVIAARVDVYGDGLNETLLEKMNMRVGEIGERYEKPPERSTEQPHFKRDERDFRKRDHGRKNFRERTGSKSKKKRKRIGRR